MFLSVRECILAVIGQIPTCAFVCALLNYFVFARNFARILIPSCSQQARLSTLCQILIYFWQESLIYYNESVIHCYESVICYKESVIHYYESVI